MNSNQMIMQMMQQQQQLQQQQQQQEQYNRMMHMMLQQQNNMMQMFMLQKLPGANSDNFSINSRNMSAFSSSSTTKSGDDSKNKEYDL